MSEGSVYRRKNGTYCAKYKNNGGTWKYIYCKTKPEAKRALRAALADRDAGITPVAKMTVGLLLDQWLEDISGTIHHRTWLSRESIVRVHIKPTLGSHRLSRLSHTEINKLYKSKLNEGLAPSTVKLIHVILNQAMMDAVRLKYIRSNPLDRVRAPKLVARDYKILTTEQIHQLFSAIRDTRYEPTIVLGAACGLRVGEALAIRHEDIDLHAGTILIERTLWRGQTYDPKTDKSRRRLKLPKVAIEVISRFSCKDKGGWLLETAKGKPVSAPNFHLAWKRILRQSGLPDTKFHTLRHGAASLMLANNVPVPVVSRYLGHSNSGTTMRVYAHMIDGMGGLAADGIDDALG